MRAVAKRPQSPAAQVQPEKKAMTGDRENLKQVAGQAITAKRNARRSPLLFPDRAPFSILRKMCECRIMPIRKTSRGDATRCNCSMVGSSG